MNHAEAVSRAEKFLEESREEGEPELAIDYDRIREKGENLVVPYNSAKYLQTRNEADMALGCWPMLVNLTSGEVRFGGLEDRPF
ncbi:YrhB domain-containing protein [Streptomyces gamaensis]|uniref:YrhB domain-containing protein n=1 Tax=Streptomyces gamaensis TaxID=1763542 RepID=A0ABW0Z8H6_9ACTN